MFANHSALESSQNAHDSTSVSEMSVFNAVIDFDHPDALAIATILELAEVYSNAIGKLRMFCTH